MSRNRIHRLVRGSIVGSLAAALLASSPVASGATEEGAVGAPRLEVARHGKTPRGATRIVLQTDRTIEYLAVELPEGNGVDVHLLGTGPESVRDALKIGDGRVDDVTFRREPSGVVARILGTGDPLRVKSFRLVDPARVVVDVYPGQASSAPAPASVPPAATPTISNDTPANETDLADAGIRLSEARAATRGEDPKTPVAEPQLVRKEYRTTQPVAKAPVKVASGAEKSAATAPEKVATSGDAEDTPVSEPAAASRFELGFGFPAGADPSDADFDDLLLWIHALKTRVDALRAVDSEIERAALRRELAFLLAERGIYGEAERALLSSIDSEGRDESTAFADSLTLAEIRLRLGKTEEAAEIATAVDARERSAAESFRLARILFECGLVAPAIALVEPAIPSLPEPDRSHGKLLLARARWDQGESKTAYGIVRGMTESSKTPPDILSSALILEADCHWTAGRFGDAESHYRRAAGLRLSPEEASWTGLQLGNLARRAGREDEALRHWKTTSEKWPETFYGSQADWFLRVAEQYGRLRDEEVVRNRG